MRSSQYAAPRRDADTGGGVAGDSTPGLLPEAGLLGLDVRRSRFEGLGHLDGREVPEPLFCGNEGV